MSDAVGTEGFYDMLAGDYDDAIIRCVPRYFEMLAAILRYVPDGLEPRRILELGCGSGHLTRRVLKAFPLARVAAVDLSHEMLLRCRQTTDRSRLDSVRMDFRDLCFAPGTFDLVLSSIAIHHIDHEAKQKMFREVFACLRPGGVFAYSDQFSGGTAEIYAKHIQAWEEDAKDLGASVEEWRTWMQHQSDHDHHATLPDQEGWLGEAGFGAVDCVWRYLLWTVVVAERPVEFPSAEVGITRRSATANRSAG